MDAVYPEKAALEVQSSLVYEGPVAAAAAPFVLLTHAVARVLCPFASG